jgi:hypothetical protein
MQKQKARPDPLSASKITGIPQPSLSRFFNSNAMPRRQTLIKIASAMKVDAIKAYNYGV